MFAITDYDFSLPPAAIAQEPAAKRDEARLMVLDRCTGAVADRKFGDLLGLLKAGDLLVVNDTKVFPARLIGKKESGGRVELFILDYPRTFVEDSTGVGRGKTEILGLLKSSKGARVGSRLIFPAGLVGEVLTLCGDGKIKVSLSFPGDFAEVLDRCGQVPLPPYIKREESGGVNDRERYQTVYAREAGAVAAPTAGLHFTPQLLEDLAGLGVKVARLTLHVGYGTFAPVRVDDIRQHQIHREYLKISTAAAELINMTKLSGGRIWAVGTTSARALEASVGEDGFVLAQEGWIDLYIYPGHQFRVVGNLITNFHLPRSSLLFLVSALVGRERLLAAYAHAVAEGYRFYSYGDAMAIMS
ncbi:MAG: tRNA preQ1(34) S-adenosylmethionine ribosyltransferase-isomerase QueA [Desulfobulbaceae bacterium]|nr:tRNA preQ1(34) S-adenosylmethionine ribosyltransferase-isomerase QueA [Desulfobulbaceae bacterium]